jgi:hypothetical protein
MTTPTSKFKDPIENTQPFLSDAETEVKGQPSKPSANSDNMQPSIQPLKQKSEPMLSNAKSPKMSNEQAQKFAMLIRVSAQRLEAAGYIKRQRVLSKSDDLVETRLVFDAALWTTSLELLTTSETT